MKKVLYLPLILSFVFVMVFPVPSSAATGVPFGGLAVTMITCTCQYTSAFYPYMITFTPLYLAGIPVGKGKPTGIAVPTALAFLNYKIHPGVWALGFYTPGLQGCWQTAGYSCKVQANQIGSITPPFAGFAGSSP